MLRFATSALAAAATAAGPPDAGFGVSSDADFANCVLTCKDAKGNPAPQLCHPLGRTKARQQVGVVATNGGGARDLFQYGANGTEWRQWLPANGDRITSIPVFNSAGYGFSSSLNEGLLCAAHARGIRVLDSDIVGGTPCPAPPPTPP